MMVVPLKLHHLQNIVVQGSQTDVVASMSDDFMRELFQSGWAILDGDVVAAAFGLYPLDDSGRFLALTLLRDGIGPRRLLFAARAARRWLDRGEYRRVEAYVVEGVETEYRWCERLLGLTHEGMMRAASPDGRGLHIFGRVGNGY